MFKKNDLLIIAAVLLLASAAFLAVKLAGNSDPGRVEIRVNGKLTASYSLGTDREFNVTGYDGGEVHGIISGGTVDVTAASCPDKICVDHSVIRHTGESIICLPNRVVITITAGNNTDDDGTIDAVVGD